MNAAFENIVLVCLDGKLCRSVSEKLSEKLDMFFADLKAYIEYDLMDTKAVLETCGIEYFDEREFMASANFPKFSNSVLTVDFDLFKKNRKAFTKQSLIIYLKLAKKLINKAETVNILAFDSHDKYLEKESNLTIEIKHTAVTKAVKEIINFLGEAL